MKNKSILICFFPLLSLISCSDPQNKPLKDISGTWKVTRLRYVDSELKKDSLATPKAVFLSFNSCSKEENKAGTSNCDLIYMESGLSLPFNYQVSGKTELGINGARYTGPMQKEYRYLENVLSGGYTILQLDNSSLRLSGDRLCNATIGQPETCRYHIEIDAERE